MNSRRLIESLLGVAGLWLIARSLPDYATTLALHWTGGLPVPDVGFDFFRLRSWQFFFTVLVGVGLIATRRPLARWLQPEGADVTLDPPSFLMAGIALLGIYFVVSGLTDLSQYLGAIGIGRELRYLLWRSALNIGVGASLLIASPWIARRWRTRTAGPGSTG